MRAVNLFLGIHTAGKHPQHLAVKCPSVLEYPETNTRQVKAITRRMTDNLSKLLICLGIKTGRQLRDPRQQSIPRTICFRHLHEPNDYVRPAVSTERMNTFMPLRWTAQGARIDLCMNFKSGVVGLQIRITFGWIQYMKMMIRLISHICFKMLSELTSC